MAGFRLSEPAPAVVQKANEIVSLAGAQTSRAKAIALFVFVRDSIKFGFTGRFDSAAPEQTLRSGMGHCNPQGALFAALLNAQGILARQRFVNLDNGVLQGVLPSQPARLVHSYVELQLPTEGNTDGNKIMKDSGKQEREGGEKWIRLDGYIADPTLFHAARAKLVREGRKEGYGIHVDGSIDWDGEKDCFCQMADERSQVTEDLGTFDVPELFYTSRKNFQRLPWPVRMAFGLIVATSNSSLDKIRAEYVHSSEKKS